MVRILSLGATFENVEEIDFSSKTSMEDADIFILDIRDLGINSLGYNAINSKGQYDKLVVETQKRIKDIYSALNSGRLLVIFPFPQPKIKIQSPQSGAIIEVPEYFDQTTWAGRLFTEQEGENIEFEGPEFLKLFVDYTMQYYRYYCFLNKKIGQPFLKIKNSNKYVATYIRKNSGHILILPYLESNKAKDMEARRAEGRRTLDNQFIGALAELFLKLPSLETKQIIIPKWVNDFSVPDEPGLESKISRVESEIKIKEADLERLRNEKFNKSKEKVLFFGQGDPLVEQVAELFKEIGFKVEIGTDEKDDLKLWYGNKFAVAEVKGQKKSAKTKDGRQLEQWVSDNADDDKGIIPKGILVVNTFCETVLDKRTEIDFPPDVIQYCSKRGHCLLTGLQLLNMVYSLRDKKVTKKELINFLFSAEGQIKGYDSWKSFISKKT